MKRLLRYCQDIALDLLIAATALEYDLTLVTDNIEDFKDIPDLNLH
jgi:predicted nucleic acid-binding protein